MKISMYLKYPARSLVRGGGRTILALFCVIIGVMGIVALQLVGQMMNNSFLSTIRHANDGDITVAAFNEPFAKSDLTFFDSLKLQGKIRAYTAVNRAEGAIGSAPITSNSFNVFIIDPVTYAQISSLQFVAPDGSKLETLLLRNQIIIDQSLADQYHKKIGDSIDLHTVTGQMSGSMHVSIVGIVANTGAFALQKGNVLVSHDTYQTANPDSSDIYNGVNILTDGNQASIDAASKAIQQRFPFADTETYTDQLKNNQDQINLITLFLEIAGLLTLLIGGVGIINTMQVLLSRRKIEIAMLKANGYRKRDLYLLFGLEASFLGLIGGVVGALLAIGVSYLVKLLVENFTQITILFGVDPLIVAGGILIGFSTTLIFGLIPIVQAANTRPLNVIREIPDGQRVVGAFRTFLLMLVLLVLFCIMSAFILNNVTAAIVTVVSGFIFLGLLSLLFRLVVRIISKLPVPEKFSLGYLMLVTVALIVSIVVCIVVPATGGLLLFISVMGYIVVLMPREWKMNIKLSLRNVGSQGSRTTSTMLALFIGVFTIGLILVLGQDIGAQLNDFIAKTVSYNLIVQVHGQNADSLASQLHTIKGVTKSEVHVLNGDKAITMDGITYETLLQNNNFDNTDRQNTANYLSSIEGYQLGSGQVPDLPIAAGNGRNLSGSDAQTNNVLVNSRLAQLPPPLNEHFKPGKDMTIASLDGKTKKTLHIVGLYDTNGTSNFGEILAPAPLAKAFALGGQTSSVFYLKVDANQSHAIVSALEQIAPDARVYNLADLGDYINQIVGNIMIVLVGITSLFLLAGLIIIANAVALTMLQRRRELGILKSVGYTSRTILSTVLIENGIIGGIGAFIAMLVVTLATSLIGQLLFQASFGVSWYIALGLILGIALLAMLTATAVSWSATHVRPIEVLRYE